MIQSMVHTLYCYNSTSDYGKPQNLFRTCSAWSPNEDVGRVAMFYFNSVLESSDSNSTFLRLRIAAELLQVLTEIVKKGSYTLQVLLTMAFHHSRRALAEVVIQYIIGFVTFQQGWEFALLLMCSWLCCSKSLILMSDHERFAHITLEQCE